MLRPIATCIKTCWKFGNYRPQRVSPFVLWRWLRQFRKNSDKQAVLALLDKVIYVSERELERSLVFQNQALLEWLSNSGIPPDKVIYLQYDKAGSSSPAVLKKLRDRCKLEHKGCTLLDYKDVSGLNEATNRLDSGAIIYVDDFSGSGDQFIDSMAFVRKYIVGTFTEFLLVHTICEEAILQLGQNGIVPFSHKVHSKAERPLHPNSNVLPLQVKERLHELSNKISPVQALGYKNLATMVVFYDNAPDTVPLILRGNEGQKPFCGIIPRTDDLPDS